MFDAPSFAQGTVIGGGDVRAVSYGEDKGLFVEFRTEPFYNEFRSKTEGKPVYDDRVMVKIYVPGDKTKVIDRLAVLDADLANGIPTDPQRWPQQWEAYKRGEQMVMEGTPLAQWPMMTKHHVAELNAMNVYTVEQLAEMSDTALNGIGHGGRTIRDQAIAWLERAKEDGAFAKMEAKHASEMKEMRAQIEALRASMQAPEETKRGPGRPRKEQTDVE